MTRLFGSGAIIDLSYIPIAHYQFIEKGKFSMNRLGRTIINCMNKTEKHILQTCLMVVRDVLYLLTFIEVSVVNAYPS